MKTLFKNFSLIFTVLIPCITVVIWGIRLEGRAENTKSILEIKLENEIKEQRNEAKSIENGTYSGKPKANSLAKYAGCS